MGKATFDPRLPWGGLRGSPCGDLTLQRERVGVGFVSGAALVELSFMDLADCRECPKCGGCLTHYDCLRDPDHVTWFAQFALPGEPACGAQRVFSGWNVVFTCDLQREHGGEIHLDMKGNGWAVSPAGSSRPRSGRSWMVALLRGRLLRHGGNSGGRAHSAR